MDLIELGTWRELGKLLFADDKDSLEKYIF